MGSYFFRKDLASSFTGDSSGGGTMALSRSRKYILILSSGLLPTAVSTLLSMVLLYVFLQKYIVAGITAGAVKG
jgi:ABC-type glycerol-3-phosphate transport system permease component